jgi:hypothetical protein
MTVAGRNVDQLACIFKPGNLLMIVLNPGRKQAGPG